VLRGKNGRPRVIPLNTKAKAVAEYQLNDATVGEYLFPSSKTGEMLKEVKKGFASACDAAGIKYGLYDSEGVTFHTLRHWFNTKLEDLGVSKTVRRDLLGHTPVDVTDDYTHSTIEMRRSAVEMLCYKKPEGVASFQSTVAKSWQVTQQEKAVSLSY
jgi:integrase